jgi:hypothetical protein
MWRFLQDRLLFDSALSPSGYPPVVERGHAVVDVSSLVTFRAVALLASIRSSAVGETFESALDSIVGDLDSPTAIARLTMAVSRVLDSILGELQELGTTFSSVLLVLDGVQKNDGPKANEQRRRAAQRERDLERAADSALSSLFSRNASASARSAAVKRLLGHVRFSAFAVARATEAAAARHNYGFVIADGCADVVVAQLASRLQLAWPLEAVMALCADLDVCHLSSTMSARRTKGASGARWAFFGASSRPPAANLALLLLHFPFVAPPPVQFSSLTHSPLV